MWSNKSTYPTKIICEDSLFGYFNVDDVYDFCELYKMRLSGCPNKLFPIYFPEPISLKRRSSYGLTTTNHVQLPKSTWDSDQMSQCSLLVSKKMFLIGFLFPPIFIRPIFRPELPSRRCPFAPLVPGFLFLFNCFSETEIYSYFIQSYPVM